MDSFTLLKELVAIKSVFPNEKNAAEFVEMLLIENGFQVSRLEISKDRFNLLAERGTKGKPIMFYGHLDTVPPYGNWAGDPFVLREEGDKLMGLGAADMKAGVAAILKASEEETERKIKIAFGVDEENISEGAHAIAKSGFFSDVEFCLVPEGPSPGPDSITLGRRGRCVIEVVVPGRSAHGAHSERGINAINEASRLVLELSKINGSLVTHLHLPPATQFVRRMSAESTSLSVPEVAVIEIDRHMVPPETPESVLRVLREFITSLYSEGVFSEIDGKRITVNLKQRKTPYLPPYMTPSDNLYVKLLSAVVKKNLGSVNYIYQESVADENVFAPLGVPIASIGPKGGDEHTCNEWVSKSSYFKLIEVMKTFIISC